MPKIFLQGGGHVSALEVRESGMGLSDHKLASKLELRSRKYDAGICRERSPSLPRHQFCTLQRGTSNRGDIVDAHHGRKFARYPRSRGKMVQQEESATSSRTSNGRRRRTRGITIARNSSNNERNSGELGTERPDA